MRKTGRKERTATKEAGMKPRSRSIERAIGEAERLFRTAVRRYRRAVTVICNARIARAAESMKEAGRMVQKAMRLLARPVSRRLGFVGKTDVGDLCHVLHDFGTLQYDASEHSPGMLEYVLKDLPRRDALDSWLIREGRAVLDEFARIGRLDPQSEEARRLHALVRTEFERLLPEWWRKECVLPVRRKQPRRARR